MASLQKRSNGRYYIYFYDKNRDPKRKSVPTGTSRKRAARRIFRRLEDEYATGDFDPWMDDAKPLPISDAIQRFLKSKSNLQPKSQEAYREILENWPLPPTLMIQDVQPKHIRPYVCDQDNVVRRDERTLKGRRKERVSIATLRKRYRHLRTFFNWSVKQGLIDSNPSYLCYRYHSLRTRMRTSLRAYLGLSLLAKLRLRV